MNHGEIMRVVHAASPMSDAEREEMYDSVLCERAERLRARAGRLRSVIKECKEEEAQECRFWVSRKVPDSVWQDACSRDVHNESPLHFLDFLDFL